MDFYWAFNEPLIGLENLINRLEVYIYIYIYISYLYVTKHKLSNPTVKDTYKNH